MQISITAICILAFATAVTVQSENIMSVVRNCKGEKNCKENIIEILRSQGDPQTEECYCALGCVGKATGILTANNGVDKEKLKMVLGKMHVPDDKAEIIIEKCQSDSAPDECAAAKTVTQCMKGE